MPCSVKFQDSLCECSLLQLPFKQTRLFWEIKVHSVNSECFLWKACNTTRRVVWNAKPVLSWCWFAFTHNSCPFFYWSMVGLHCFCGHRTENTAHATRQPLAPWLFAGTLRGWCLPEFLPCWACCSSGSSRHGKRPPHSAFSPSQPRCRWHRTSRSGHRRFCMQGKES